MRISALALGLVLATAGPAAAEWQLTPSFGISFGGGTTFLFANASAEEAAGNPNAVFGLRGVLLGEVFGVEADFGVAPGIFQRGLFQFGPERVSVQGGDDLEFSSNATTLTGNIVIAMPRRLTEYTLRPYAVAGMGLMRVAFDDPLSARSTLTAIDVGGGITGFLTDRIGLNWDFRRYWSVGGSDQEQGFSLGDEQLSFWRASMGLVIRLGAGGGIR